MHYNIYWQSFPILIFFIISSISIASCPTKNLTSLLLEMMYTVSTAFWTRTLNDHIKFKQKCEGNHFSISPGPCWFSWRIRWWWRFCREFLIGRWSIGNLWEWKRESTGLATVHMFLGEWLSQNSIIFILLLWTETFRCPHLIFTQRDNHC